MGRKYWNYQGKVREICQSENVETMIIFDAETVSVHCEETLKGYSVYNRWVTPYSIYFTLRGVTENYPNQFVKGLWFISLAGKVPETEIRCIMHTEEPSFRETPCGIASYLHGVARLMF